MLSKRNFVTMLTIFAIVLVLFLSSAVLKEYFNDYDVNHFALEDRIPQENSSPASGGSQHVIYVGSRNTDLYQPIREWAGYRKMSFHPVSNAIAAVDRASAYGKENAWLLLGPGALERDPQQTAEALTAYVQEGGTVIFCSMPAYQTIQSCDTLRKLLGIQKLRAESVELLEYWLYEGFLLGGDVCYPFDELQNPKNLDMERRVPWYDVSAGAKTYMVGYIPIQEREQMGLSREDMPAIIWRQSTGTGRVFAVNGNFMEGPIALGLLDAMVYESREYALYAVVNAQNLSITGFPDLTNENEEKMAQAYAYNTQQFCRDILWPSLVAAANNGDWKITAFTSIKQSNDSDSPADMKSFIEYLKYYNEVSTEAGIALGRIKDPSIRRSMAEEKEMLDGLGLTYAFTAGYVRPENEAQLPRLVKANGYMDVFPDIRTVVTAHNPGQNLLSWMNGGITRQTITMDGFRHTYTDNLRLKSLQTALGYSNVQADIYRVLWLENQADTWEQVAEVFSSGIATYWKPFAAFEKTTITESDRRVRIFLNETVTSTASPTPSGREISVQVENFYGQAWLMLRTHGEKPVSMEGGTWELIEKDAYLLHLTADTATVVLGPNQELYYYKGT